MKNMSKSRAALEKREEKVHKDLDHDGEKGESAAHKAKVLGKKGASKSAPFGGKQAAPFGKKTAKKSK